MVAIQDPEVVRTTSSRGAPPVALRGTRWM
jgi:hypothetical protein